MDRLKKKQISCFLIAPMLEALIGWIPLVVAVFMAVIGFLFPIEKEVAEMNAAKGLRAEHS